MADDPDDTGKSDAMSDVNDAQTRIINLAKTLTLIDPDIETDPAMISRIRQLVDLIPEKVVSDLLQCVSDLEGAARLDVGQFCANFKISPAEMRLLSSLIAGGTVSSYAHEVGISVNTARTHMRRLLEKTGAANQLDLFRRYFAG